MNLRFRHLAGAALLHALLLVFLLTEVQCSRKPEPVNVVQGVLMRPDQVPKLAPPAPPPAPVAPAPTPPAPPPAASPPPAPPPPPPAKPEPPKPDPAVLRQQEAQKAAELKKQADLADQKRKADEAKKKAEADEKKRVEDAQKQLAAEEAKRVADDKKRKEAQAKADAEARRQREAELSKAIGAEAEQRTAAEINFWATQLVAAIQRAWTRPPGADGNFSAKVNIQLSQTGDVLSASIRQSSGNPQFDDSVIRAVYKASPLPLPRDPSAFQSSINITFTPRL